MRSVERRGEIAADPETIFAFLADHLEVLYDVDIGAREQAIAAGMAFARIESLNVAPRFIDALATIAMEAAAASRLL